MGAGSCSLQHRFKMSNIFIVEAPVSFWASFSFCLVAKILCLQVNYLHFRSTPEATATGGKHTGCGCPGRATTAEKVAVLNFMPHQSKFYLGILPRILQGHEDRRNCLNVPRDPTSNAAGEVRFGSQVCNSNPSLSLQKQIR